MVPVMKAPTAAASCTTARHRGCMRAFHMVKCYLAACTCLYKVRAGGCRSPERESTSRDDVPSAEGVQNRWPLPLQHWQFRCLRQPLIRSGFRISLGQQTLLLQA